MCNKNTTHAINLKGSLSHNQIYLWDWERAQEGTQLLKKFSEIKSGFSDVVGCSFIFLLSQALVHDYCAYHWPCTDEALHKKIWWNLLIASLLHWALSQVNDTLSKTKKTKRPEDQKSPWVHLSNNLIFRPPWTFHDPYKSPSVFLQRTSRTQSANGRQEMGGAMAGNTLWFYCL